MMQDLNNSTRLGSKVVSLSLPNAQNKYVGLLGHWVYDGTTQCFLLDELSAHVVGIKDHHQWHHASIVTRYSNNFGLNRFVMNMQEGSLGDVIFERITFLDGPYRNETFIIQGSVLQRDNNNQAIWAMGYISHVRSPHSEFIARELSGDGIFIWDGTDDDVICSASMHIMMGYQEDEFPRKFIDLVETLVHPDDNDFLLVLRQIKLSAQYGDYFESCLRLQHKDGHYIWAICRCLVQERNEQGIAMRGIGSVTDINLVKDSFENIKLMMFTDSLTGLHNRTYLQQNALRYEEDDCYPLSVIFIDISGLKLTNDILGHSYGDYLLTQARDIINQAIQEVTGLSLVQPITEKHHHDEFVSPLPEHYFGPNDSWNENDFCTLQSGFLKAHELKEQRFKDSDHEESGVAADHLAYVREHMTLIDESQEGHLEESDYLEAAAKGAQNQAEPKQACSIELIRLAGDEFLLLLPHCSDFIAQKILIEIVKRKESSNKYQREHIPISTRPVPLYFGIGYATWNEPGFDNDNLKTVIDRADARMQACKDERRAHDYQYLKAYFEEKKGRPVSMRDERRVEVLSQEEREKNRTLRSGSMML